MRKPVLAALAAATLTSAAAAGTGLAAPTVKVLTLKVGEIIGFKSGNFHCQALTATQVACGANSLPNSVQVYFAPHQLEVLKFDKTGRKASVLFNAKR